MEKIIQLMFILTCCSCTYFNFKDIESAKNEVKSKCHSEVNSNVVSSCQNGVDFFTYAGLASPELSGDEEKLREQIEDYRQKASQKCDARYGDDDRGLVACGIGVEFAASKARQMFLYARIGESIRTSEFAINENIENSSPESILEGISQSSDEAVRSI